MFCEIEQIDYSELEKEALEVALEMIEEGKVDPRELLQLSQELARFVTPTSNIELRQLSDDDEDVFSRCGNSPKRISRMISKQIAEEVHYFLIQHFPNEK